MKQVELGCEEQFRAYLSDRVDNSRVINDCISRCRRIQKHEGTLIEHFNMDRGRSLSDKLSYTLEDVNRCISPKHLVTIAGQKC